MTMTQPAPVSSNTNPANPACAPVSIDTARCERLLTRFREDIVGKDTHYQLADGETRRRVYLDSTASCLSSGLVREIMASFLPHYANTHTEVHFGASIANREYRWAHEMVLDFCNADPKRFGCFFVGSGATAGINRIARTMSRSRPDRNVVITTAMEHHSNDLPHRKYFERVVHVPVASTDLGVGTVDLDAVEAALKTHGDKVNYIAITGVSNVTGMINPIHEVAILAHRYNTLILVDGAQMAAHAPIQMSGHDDPAKDIDLLVLSGHKIYAPGSPGAVVTRLDLFGELDPDEVGGNMVDDVHLDRVDVTGSFPDREEAGTPNIVGAVALGAVLYALKQIGMPWLFEEEKQLLAGAVRKLGGIKDVIIYGSTDTDRYPRAGAVSFNVRNMHYALTAAIMNDYFNVSVRNGCFCAHPYVREMVSDELMKLLENGLEEITNEEMDAVADLHRGMVRASFGIYNDEADVDYLVQSLAALVKDRDFYESQYEYLGNDQFRHKSFRFDSSAEFSAAATAARWLEA